MIKLTPDQLIQVDAIIQPIIEGRGRGEEARLCHDADLPVAHYLNEERAAGRLGDPMLPAAHTLVDSRIDANEWLARDVPARQGSLFQADAYLRVGGGKVVMMRDATGIELAAVRDLLDENLTRAQAKWRIRVAYLNKVIPQLAAGQTLGELEATMEPEPELEPEGEPAPA